MRFFRERSADDGSSDRQGFLRRGQPEAPDETVEPVVDLDATGDLPSEHVHDDDPDPSATSRRTGRISRPSGRGRGTPVVDEPSYQDPFAARARLRSMPARGPTPRRIWDLDEPEANRANEERMDDAPPEHLAPDPSPDETSERMDVSRLKEALAVERGTAAPKEAGDSEFAAPQWPEPGQKGRLPSDAWTNGQRPQTLPHTTANEPAPRLEEARAHLARVASGGDAPRIDASEDDAATHGAAAPSGRAKTRLLGFQARDLAARDPFAKAATGESVEIVPFFPVGWIVVTEGPGRGASFALHAGVSSIGRGDDQVVRLDFGDTSVSRQNHASIAFDDEAERFFLGHGGKSNLVRLNGRPVLSTEDLSHGDLIRIGETTLRFVALCGEDFSWAEGSTDPALGGETAEGRRADASNG